MSGLQLWTIDRVRNFRQENIDGIAGVVLLGMAVPPEAQEMLELANTALHAMEQLVAGPDKTLRCAFCGHEYPTGTPESKSQTLADHIRECPSHPVGIENRKLRTALDAAKHFIDWTVDPDHERGRDNGFDEYEAAVAGLASPSTGSGEKVGETA